MMKKLSIIVFALILTGCAHDDKAYEDQVKLYNEIRTTNNPSSMFRIAESMRKAGNLETAINLYQQVLQIEPDRMEAYIGLSQCLRLTGRNDAAIETLKIVPKGKESQGYFKEMGAVYTSKQQPKACIESYMKAYKLDGKDLATLNGLGVCYDLAGQHDEAQKWYQEAINLAPAHEKLRSNLGLSLALAGKAQEAISVLKPVVDSKDATKRDRQNLAIAYGMGGNMDLAAKLFAQDLDETDVRTNLAFINKLHKSQQNATKPLTTKQLKEAFESNLGQEEKIVINEKDSITNKNSGEKDTASAKASFMKNFATNEITGPQVTTTETIQDKADSPGQKPLVNTSYEESIVKRVTDKE